MKQNSWSRSFNATKKLKVSRLEAKNAIHLDNIFDIVMRETTSFVEK